MTVFLIPLEKAGPYVGPRGGKWEDAKHTIPWKQKQLGLFELFDRPVKKLTPREEAKASPWAHTAASYQAAMGVHEPWIAEISPAQFGMMGKRAKTAYQEKRSKEWQASGQVKQEWAEAVLAAHTAGKFDKDSPGVTGEALTALSREKTRQEKAAFKQTVEEARQANVIQSMDQIKVGMKIHHVAMGGGVVEKISKKSLRMKLDSGMGTAKAYLGALTWVPIQNLEAQVEAGVHIGPPEVVPTAEHRYLLRNRPAGFGGTPKGHVSVEPHPGSPHGVVVYDRPLTPEEIKSYELEPILDAAELTTRVDVAAARLLSEYPEEQRELAEEDPRNFAMAARQAIVDQGSGHIPDIDALVEQVRQQVLASSVTKSMLLTIPIDQPERFVLRKAGPYIGPRGGKWVDPEHKISWEAIPGKGQKPEEWGKLPPGKTAKEHVQIASTFLRKHKAVFNESMTGIKGLAGEGEVMGRTKALQSAVGKLMRKPKLYPTADKLTDGTGMRVIHKTIKDVQATVAAIKAKYKILDDKDYITKPLGSYRSHHLIIEGPGGLAMEVQVRTANQNTLADWTHNVYKPVTAEQAAHRKDPEVLSYEKTMAAFMWAADNEEDPPPPPRPGCTKVISLAFGCL